MANVANMYHFVAEAHPALCLADNAEIPTYTLQYLKDFQVQAVSMLYEKLQRYSFALLNDESGLGKSVTMVALLSAIGRHKRTLLILPSQEKFINDWRFHFHLLSDIAVCPVKGADDLVARAHNIYLAPWNVLHKIERLADFTFDYVLVDDRGEILNNRFAESMLSKNFAKQLNFVISSVDVTADVKLVRTILRLSRVPKKEMESLKKFKDKFNLPTLNDIISKESSMEDYFQKRLILSEYIKDYRIRRHRSDYAQQLPLVSTEQYNRNFESWLSTKTNLFATVNHTTVHSSLELSEDLETDMPPLIFEPESEEEQEEDIASAPATKIAKSSENVRKTEMNLSSDLRQKRPRRRPSTFIETNAKRSPNTRSMERKTRSNSNRPKSKYMNNTLHLLSDRKAVRRRSNANSQAKRKKVLKEAGESGGTILKATKTKKEASECKLKKVEGDLVAVESIDLDRECGTEKRQAMYNIGQQPPAKQLLDCNCNVKDIEPQANHSLGQSPAVFSSESDMSSLITPAQAAHKSNKSLSFPGFKLFGTEQSTPSAETEKAVQLPRTELGHETRQTQTEEEAPSTDHSDIAKLSAMLQQDQIEEYDYFDVTSNNEFGSRMHVNDNGDITPETQMRRLQNGKITKYLKSTLSSPTSARYVCKPASTTPSKTRKKNTKKSVQKNTLNPWIELGLSAEKRSKLGAATGSDRVNQPTIKPTRLFEQECPSSVS